MIKKAARRKGSTSILWIRHIFTFFAPTAFTPDGDKVKDAFVVKGNGIDPQSFKMDIFDRWGEQVFETTDFIKGWDGRIKDGKKGETGEYTWFIIFKDSISIVLASSALRLVVSVKKPTLYSLPSTLVLPVLIST